MNFLNFCTLYIQAYILKLLNSIEMGLKLEKSNIQVDRSTGTKTCPKYKTTMHQNPIN